MVNRILLSLPILFFLLTIFIPTPVQAEIPLEAEKHMVRGQAAIKHAESESDYKDAVREFGKAAELAPDWADAYYNLSVAREGAGQYKEAIQSIKRYIDLAPNAPDVKDAQRKLFELEYLAEKKAEKKASPNFDSLSNLSWYPLFWGNDSIMPQRHSQNWHSSERTNVERLSINGDRFEVVIMSSTSLWTFKGTMRGNKIHGTLRYKVLYDGYPEPNPAEHKFTGTIWPENKEIMLVGRGVYVWNTETGINSHKPGSYYHSFLLKSR